MVAIMEWSPSWCSGQSSYSRFVSRQGDIPFRRETLEGLLRHVMKFFQFCHFVSRCGFIVQVVKNLKCLEFYRLQFSRPLERFAIEITGLRGIQKKFPHAGGGLFPQRATGWF